MVLDARRRLHQLALVLAPAPAAAPVPPLYSRVGGPSFGAACIH
eukprot:COSAG03_NODE_3807_length_1821_cov_2.594657_1_plen_43_part_10